MNFYNYIFRRQCFLGGYIIKIFISSTSYDLIDLRALVVDRLQKRGHEVLYHESPTFPANLGLHSHDQCIKAIKHCDIVVCLIDRRYGGLYQGKFNFSIEPFKIKSDKVELEITIPAEKLSITWCELIEAYNLKKHVITFARQKTLDEKQTRRKNQELVSFRPAYAQGNEVFDFIDWITKKQENNWIVPFENIVDFEQKLITWITEVEKSFIFSSNNRYENSGEDFTESSMKVADVSEDSIEVSNEDRGPSQANNKDIYGEEQNIEISSKSISSDYENENNRDLFFTDIEKGYTAKRRITFIVEDNSQKFIVNLVLSKLKLKSEIFILSIQGLYSEIKDFSDFIRNHVEQSALVLTLLNKENANYQENFSESIKKLTVDLSERVSFIVVDPHIESWFKIGFSGVFLEETVIKNKETLRNLILHGNEPDFYNFLKRNYNLELAMENSTSLKSFVEQLLKLN
ncbi:DUF4062 domain-containing protein [Paenibacillus oleatilyticus]|uniref:DUF4062 domain-containing protein n=1 Tax=Paenibacillus oleatilyticus TaxID=2594886 RepID=UPI001C1F83D4|nr:DUF4062 domain-containing protein [Paenibacillus oleatilyticus]MBU7315380.1 DUF4062 domain-containing protein [Paenibacillus oleatilyticus]